VSNKSPVAPMFGPMNMPAADEPPPLRGDVTQVDSGTSQHGRYAGVPYILRDGAPANHAAVGDWGLLKPAASKAMATIHAWFSIETASRFGSALYRKPHGGTVNVTRMSYEKDGKGSYRVDEKYVGEVIRSEDGGCVRASQIAAGNAG